MLKLNIVVNWSCDKKVVILKTFSLPFFSKMDKFVNFFQIFLKPIFQSKMATKYCSSSGAKMFVFILKITIKNKKLN